MQSTASPAPAVRRGRPRSRQAEQAVLDATLAELADHGFLGLSIEAIAERSGVAKTTIYRWWPDKVAVALDALRSLPELPDPDTGSLEGDFRELRRGLLELVTETSLGAVLPVLIAEHQRGTAHRPEIDRYIAARSAPFARATRRAIDRGELPAGVDPAFAALLCAAPIVYSILFGDQPLDDAASTRVIAVMIAGFRAEEIHMTESTA